MSLPGKGRIEILADLFLGLLSLKNVGQEPPQEGGRKVAVMLLKFLKTDAGTRTWFVKSCNPFFRGAFLPRGR
jgi:hypothetical protein